MPPLTIAEQTLRRRFESLLPSAAELRSPQTSLFILFALVLSWGFIHFDVRDVWFAKQGLPILEILGFSPNSKLKLFVTEIFLLFSLGLAALNWYRSAPKDFLGNKLVCLAIAFLGFAVLRAVPDLLREPILVVRNLSFAWYLLIPLALYQSAVPTKLMEFIAAIISVLGVAYFFGHTALSIITLYISPYWIPFLGVYAFLFLSLGELDKKWSKIFLIAIGVELGFAFHLVFQRTSLVGMTILFTLWSIQRLRRRELQTIGKAILLLGLGVVFGYWGLHFCKKHLDRLRFDPSFQTRFASPLQKAEGSGAGLGENFRQQMWIDAAEKFREHPFQGVGFREQVVTRFHLVGHGLVPNDGFTYAKYMGLKEPPAPISGPHNSYLNALARLGIVGLLILILHLWAGYILWKSNYLFSFFLLYAQVLYALFNVGLEGPARSFFLLLSLAVAFRVYDERRFVM